VFLDRHWKRRGMSALIQPSIRRKRPRKCQKSGQHTLSIQVCGCILLVYLNKPLRKLKSTGGCGVCQRLYKPKWLASSDVPMNVPMR